MSETKEVSYGNPAVLQAIRELYATHDIPFRELHHEPTRTSQESAAARGEPLSNGGKALVLKVDDELKLFVMPANLRLHSNSVKRFFNAKSIKFAELETLYSITQLVPGSVPPFGVPILPFDLYMDSGFRDHQRIAFNAGMLTVSHVLEFDDYRKLAKPVFFGFART